MIYKGDLTCTTRCSAPTRVLAIGAGRILAEAPPGADGHWTLTTEAEAAWIVGQQYQATVATVATAPQAQIHLVLPELVDLEFESEGADKGLTAWMDPVDLAGFPRPLIWSLFARTNGRVQMHASEFQLLADGEGVQFPVQRGQYRLTGGTIALRPGLGDSPVQLAGVTDIAADTRIDSENGQVVIDIKDSARYRLHFAKTVLNADSVTFTL